MLKLIARLQAQYPNLRYTHGTQFCWSPETSEIFYKPGAVDDPAKWSLLHETGHALLRHQSYLADVELLRLEVEAWQRARLLARDVGITIDEDHIQDCLDSYRDWLDKRSICPTCRTKCLQKDDGKTYQCFNCHANWKVGDDRFGRIYRRQQSAPR